MPDQAPPKKPKKFMPMLDMLNTEAAVNTLSPKTYADFVGIFSRKAFENGEIDVDEYLEIVKPLFGETGEMVTEKIKEYETSLFWLNYSYRKRNTFKNSFISYPSS